MRTSQTRKYAFRKRARALASACTLKLKGKMFPVIFIFSHTEYTSCKSVDSDSDSWSVSTDTPKCVWKYVGDRLTWTQWLIFNKVLHLSSVCLFTAIMPTDAGSCQATDSSQINSGSVYVTRSMWANERRTLCVYYVFPCVPCLYFYMSLRPRCSWQWHDNHAFRKFCHFDKTKISLS